jgi:hypothetical protein
MNDPVNLDALSDFVSGMSDRVPPEDEWGIGFVITGDTAAANTAHHKGEKMSREEYERRLEEHREGRDAPAGATEDTIVFNVVEADSEPFKNEIRYDGTN